MDIKESKELIRQQKLDYLQRMGLIEVPENDDDDELLSSCCGYPQYDYDTDICMGCNEHADFYTEKEMEEL